MSSNTPHETFYLLTVSFLFLLNKFAHSYIVSLFMKKWNIVVNLLRFWLLKGVLGFWLFHLPENTDFGHCRCFNAYRGPAQCSRLNQKQFPFPCVTQNNKHYSKQFRGLNIGVSAPLDTLQHSNYLQKWQIWQDPEPAIAAGGQAHLEVRGAQLEVRTSRVALDICILNTWIAFCHNQKFITCMTAQLYANFKGTPSKYCTVKQCLRDICS